MSKEWACYNEVSLTLNESTAGKLEPPSCSGEADSLRVMGSWEREHEKHSRWLFLGHLLGTAYLAGPPRPVLSSSLAR